MVTTCMARRILQVSVLTRAWDSQRPLLQRRTRP